MYSVNWGHRVLTAIIALFIGVGPVFAGDSICQQEGLDQCTLHSRPITTCQELIFGRIPADKPNEVKICHTGYLTVSNTQTKTPDWIAYHLTAAHMSASLINHRKEYFCPDPCLAAGQRAELSDYAGLYPTFNRGHMTPAADNKWDTTAYKECYFLSNMVPQNPENNSGIWQSLESNVDKWVKLNGDLYVIDGPIYDYQGEHHQEVGIGKIWAPAALFKIIYNPVTQQVLSFIIPNKKLNSFELSKYLTSINTINQLTGLDLFSELPADVKAKTPTMLWALD